MFFSVTSLITGDCSAFRVMYNLASAEGAGRDGRRGGGAGTLAAARLSLVFWVPDQFGAGLIFITQFMTGGIWVAKSK